MMTLGLVCFLYILPLGFGYRITLTSNSPVVSGATVTFKATITEDNWAAPYGAYQFKWKDNAIPQHHYITEGAATTSYWNVTYPKDKYPPGQYEVQVEVSKWTFIYWNIGSKRLDFDITNLLNGGMNMTQNNVQVKDEDGKDYVSSAAEVSHLVYFSGPDQAFVKNATSVITYWFVDCIYYGATPDQTFKFNYTNFNYKQVEVEALVVVSFDEPVPPNTTVAPPTTTSVTPTVLPIPASNTTAKPMLHTNITTTERPTNATALVDPNLKLGTNATMIPILPYVCVNTSIIPPDPKKTYGYFSRTVDVKAPVSNVVVTGNNWLQHGDILNLSVSCNGSAPFLYCLLVTEGEYNVTGNETCNRETLIPECQITLPRYLHNAGTYTVLIIIKNQVSRNITRVGVNIYEVKKHPQLSVIVVPVACSAIAVTLIIFGAAYYMQSRHRFTIEVADFDFAQCSDMEYMTFQQRLRAAFNNAFSRAHDYDFRRLDNGSCQSRY